MESAAKLRLRILRGGESIRSVSRSTGLSRNTIKKYLKDGSPPGYRRSQDPVRHKLAGFEGRLRELFEQDQKLDLSQFRSAPGAHLSGLPFKSQRTFPRVSCISSERRLTSLS